MTDKILDKLDKFRALNEERAKIAMRVPAIHFPECREQDRPGCLCIAKALGCLQTAYFNACWDLDYINDKPHRRFNGKDK